MPRLPALRQLLTPDEIQRADRFISDKVRDDFILGRGFLRVILGEHISADPAAVHFAYGTRGKPSLVGSVVRFNLSHADDMLLLGVSDDRELGVDVERIRPMANMDTVARSNFSPLEQRVYFAQDAQQLQVFYTCWTRKEAYIKATGDGFKMPLKDFDVTCAPGDPPRLLRAVGDDPARWALLHVDLGAAYVGAVCVQAPAPTLIMRTV